MYCIYTGKLTLCYNHLELDPFTLFPVGICILHIFVVSLAFDIA